MYAVSGIIDRSRLFGGTSSRQVIDEFARWTADELDYLVEARQAALLHEHAAGERIERIARVHRDYTTSRVLTSELIEGISLYEVMIASRNKDADYLASLRARGYDPDRIVRNLDWNMLNQVFVHGYFHADLHPANLFVLPGNAIGYVDYGIVGSLPDDTRDSLTHYSWLLFQETWMPPSRSSCAGSLQRPARIPRLRARTSSTCIARSSTRWAHPTPRPREPAAEAPPLSAPARTRTPASRWTRCEAFANTN